MVTTYDVRNALKTVNDPEIQMDIVTLELVYEIDVKDDNVHIKMTLTTPMCPYGPQLLEEVNQKIKGMEGVKGVDVELTFVPPWQPSEELRAMFGV
ncbi:MAG: metal-sulfur cluster assembly factor [Candidatus Aenigmarchaeota archaeon]|nr:metal-sulfur cluster assembly factor [Candidatus Aenigmarchaeota archaeon]MDI6722132.1 metal-sulfur cluster assembly factor [Candidatus Aenigmarchaeota archaeon]